MRAFTYHVPVPPELSKVAYCDVRVDHGAFDYDALLAQWIRAASKHGFQPMILSWTENPAEPMYQRVKAMLNYVCDDGFHAGLQGATFDQPTVFLDSDAFLNADIGHIFDGDWDIGVTYRHNFGMALNEGVIFANSRNPERVQSFFKAYLETYDRLCEDPDIKAKYQNIKRWRGGQLSLNAIANPLGRPTSLDRIECHGATVAYFPCHVWNYPADSIDPAVLDTKKVIHLKGGRKHLLDELIKYQETKRA